ncbi:MAG: hypothetical protein AAGD10_07195 [Myxococcota bacterium]
MATVTALKPADGDSLGAEQAQEAVRRFFRVAFAGPNTQRASGPDISAEGWRSLSVDAFFSASFAGREKLNDMGASCGEGSVAADQVFGEFNWD